MCNLDNTEACCLVELDKFKLDSVDFMKTSVFIQLEGVLQVFCTDFKIYIFIYKDVIL